MAPKKSWEEPISAQPTLAHGGAPKQKKCLELIIPVKREKWQIGRYFLSLLKMKGTGCFFTVNFQVHLGGR